MKKNNKFKLICRKDKCIYRRMVSDNKAYCCKPVCPYSKSEWIHKSQMLPKDPTEEEIIQNARDKGLI